MGRDPKKPKADKKAAAATAAELAKAQKAVIARVFDRIGAAEKPPKKRPAAAPVPTVAPAAGVYGGRVRNSGHDCRQARTSVVSGFMRANATTRKLALRTSPTTPTGSLHIGAGSRISGAGTPSARDSVAGTDLTWQVQQVPCAHSVVSSLFCFVVACGVVVGWF
jgi:hypothetical protein